MNYDANGNLTSVTDVKGQTISYTYNLRDKVASMTDQIGRNETYSYDLSDNLISLTDRKAQATTYTYDKENQINRVDYADGSYTIYTYDAVGKLTYINDSVSGPIQYVYSNTGCGAGCNGAVDKVIQEITPLGSVSYEYDALGRRTKMQVAGQEPVTYQYDANSRLTDINTLINGVAANSSLSYDTLGRRTSLALPNGVTTNYTYDNASRLLNIEHLSPLSSVLDALSYVYDLNGNRISMNRQSANLPLPNSVTNTSYNQANQMLTFIPSTGSAKNMTYDNNGNMISVTNSCGTTTYSWDVRNRLVGIDSYKPDCTPLTASFKYDALGRRIEKTINDKTTQYLYDGLDIVQEIENGVVSVNYIRTLNIDEPLARIKTDGSIRYYQTDALGSVIALIDENGAVKTTYTYDPYGNVTVSGEMSDNTFQYTSRENDGTGLYYYRARYYSPELQRFLSEDPIGLLGGDVNLYTYVRNAPVNFIDPLGLLAFFWHEGITYVAAQDSGYGIMDSLSLAFNTAAVDFSGTQTTNPTDTVQHAMAAPLQSPAEAIASANDYIQSSINSGNLPGAIHAAQDLATPAHAGHEWQGFKWNWETAKHILGDIFPSWSTIKQAYKNTKGILNTKGCSK